MSQSKTVLLNIDVLLDISEKNCTYLQLHVENTYSTLSTHFRAKNPPSAISARLSMTSLTDTPIHPVSVRKIAGVAKRI